ncbi:MAG: hypothetical protein R3B13_37455 [Polyangiaceae bacterium]
MMVRMVAVRSPPSSSQVKSQSFPPEDESEQLAFPAVVCELDVSIFEEQRQSLPLAMQVTEGAPEAVFGGARSRCSSIQARSVCDDGLALLAASGKALRGVVAGKFRSALDFEERRDEAHSLERDGVATASCFDKPSASVGCSLDACRPRALLAIPKTRG